MDELIVKAGETKHLNNSNPVGYSKDLNEDIVILLHKPKECAFIHLEAQGPLIDLEALTEELYKKRNDLSAEIFVSKNATYNVLSIIKFIFHILQIPYKINNYYIFDNEESVGYNYNLDEYYSANVIDNMLTLRKQN